MQMFTDLFGIFHNFDQIIGKVLWMGSHKTDTLNAIYLFDLLQKLCKRHWLL